MANATKVLLLRQLETAWKLTNFHLTDLSTEECLWRPADKGLHVHVTPEQVWRADWPDREEYAVGPPSIAWITWHLGFWWSMVLDHSFGTRSLVREDVLWPGSAEATREWIAGLHDKWQAALARLTEDDMQSTLQTRWPFTARPFWDVGGWVNIELAKNAAEIGYARFLYAVRNHR